LKRESFEEEIVLFYSSTREKMLLMRLP